MHELLEPCPGTPGSDCSRCDQVKSVEPDRYKVGPPFPPPCPTAREWIGMDMLFVMLYDPKIFQPVTYLDSVTIAKPQHAWSNCADVTTLKYINPYIR